MSELVRDTIAARAAVDREAAARTTPAPDDVREAATALLADLWLAAAEHGVTAADLAAVTSLPAAALDAVTARARR